MKVAAVSEVKAVAVDATAVLFGLEDFPDFQQGDDLGSMLSRLCFHWAPLYLVWAVSP